ncbi:hypothetical protein RSJ42_08585 [Methanosarcina hadiensis]|uniref:hypothetical protein n=1 Tax=Methanosarcina hadiensis TaxID=3078083 RepID=UPI003977CC50
MISTFHPSVILCTHENWDDEKYQEKFLTNLIYHLSKIKEMKIKIAWCKEIESILWNDPPWLHYHAEPMLIETFYEIISNSIPFNPPPNNECNMIPILPVDYSFEVKTDWLILLHRIAHKHTDVFIVTSLNVDTEITSTNVWCDCRSGCNKYNYKVINDPTEWYKKIDYLTLCPKDSDNWDRGFLLALKACYKQEFSTIILKNKIENVEMSRNFKKSFIDIDDERTKKKIIIAIVQRLTYTKAEAGRHRGLRDEKIRGKRNEYSFRVSDVERIHYTLLEEGKMLLLDYHPGSEHDSRCK